MFDLEESRKMIGESLGISDWVTITQPMISGFSEMTLDPDPMHIDPEWCQSHSPYKTTIAFGFLTTSLLTHLAHNVIEYDRFGRSETTGYPLNYGFNRLRLVSPVKVGSRVRGHFSLKDIFEKNPNEYLQTIDALVEIEGLEKPALVAEWLGLWVQGNLDSKIPGKRYLNT